LTDTHRRQQSAPLQNTNKLTVHQKDILQRSTIYIFISNAI